jgi:hypothetical protein
LNNADGSIELDGLIDALKEGENVWDDLLSDWSSVMELSMPTGGSCLNFSQFKLNTTMPTNKEK